MWPIGPIAKDECFTNSGHALEKVQEHVRKRSHPSPPSPLPQGERGELRHFASRSFETASYSFGFSFLIKIDFRGNDTFCVGRLKAPDDACMTPEIFTAWPVKALSGSVESSSHSRSQTRRYLSSDPVSRWQLSELSARHEMPFVCGQIECSSFPRAASQIFTIELRPSIPPLKTKRLSTLMARL